MAARVRRCAHPVYPGAPSSSHSALPSALPSPQPRYVNENISYAFPGGAWSEDGLYSAPNGLQFSEPLAERYDGVWLDRRRLLIRLPDGAGVAGSAPPRLHVTSVHTRVGGRLTAAATLSLAH